MTATEMGGAFVGGKGYPKFKPLMARLAQHTGRPVHLRCTLEESFLAGLCAACRVRMRTGFNRDGHMVFNRATADYLIGVYADIAARFVSKTGYLAGGPYSLPMRTPQREPSSPHPAGDGLLGLRCAPVPVGAGGPDGRSGTPGPP